MLTKFKTLRLRLSLLMVILLMLTSILPMIVVGSSAYNITRGILYNEVSSYSSQFLQMQIGHVNHRFDEIENTLNTLAENPNLNSYANWILGGVEVDSVRQAMLKDMRSLIVDGSLTSIDFVSITGKVVSTSPVIDGSNDYPTGVRDILMAGAMNSPTGEYHIGGLMGEGTNPNASIITSVKLVEKKTSDPRDTAYLGFIAVNYPLDLLSDNPVGLSPEEDITRLIIVDSYKHIIYDEAGLLTGQHAPNELVITGADASGVFDTELNGEPVIANYIRSGRNVWTFISLTSDASLDSKYLTIQYNTFLILLVSIVFVLGMSTLFSMVLVWPIQKIASSFAQIQKQVFNWDTRLPHSQIREIDDLINWFNTFLDNQEIQRETEESLLDSERRYRSLFDETPVPLWEEDFSPVLQKIANLDIGNLTLDEYLTRNPDVSIDLISRIKIKDVNRATIDLYQAKSKEELMNSTADLFRNVSLVEVKQEILQMAAGTRNFELEIENSTLAGTKLSVKLRWSVFPGYEKTMGRVIVSTTDITQSKKTERLQTAILRISQAASTSDSLHDLYVSIHRILAEFMPAKNLYIALYDEVEGIVSFPYFVDQIDTAPSPRKFANGWTEYVIRTGKSLLLTPEMVDYLEREEHITNIGADSVHWLGVPLIAQDHTIGVLAVQSYQEGQLYSSEDTDLLMIVSSQIALAIDRKRAEEELKFSSTHDKLTGLYNRAYFEEEVSRLSGGRQNPVGVIMIDVDGLKMVNDTFGHAAGDELLRSAARILQQAFRTSDVVARIGGDEFAILLSFSNTATVSRAIERISESLMLYNDADLHMRVKFSLGSANTENGLTITEAIREADRAMYKEKLEKKLPGIKRQNSI